MPEKISKEEALKIALRHLVMQAQKHYEGRLGIQDGVPDGLPLYVRSETEREHCWCIFVLRIEAPSIIGAGRYIRMVFRKPSPIAIVSEKGNSNTSCFFAYALSVRKQATRYSCGCWLQKKPAKSSSTAGPGSK